MKRKLNLFAMLLSLFATAMSVYSMAGTVRTVDIIILFFSGALAGITALNFFKIKKDINQ